jgi:hypothetical protein
MVNEIKQEELNYFINIEDLLKILLSEFSLNKNNHSHVLMHNLFYLIFKIYFVTKNQNILFNKILESGLSSEIINVLDSNSNANSLTNSSKALGMSIEELQNLFENKYKFIHTILIESSDTNMGNVFYINCFVVQLINKLNNDKFIFNCVDPITFRENYNCIINFISKPVGGLNIFKLYEISEIKENVTKVKIFAHSFSFFTYFQYLQNDIAKLFIDDINKSNNVQDVLPLAASASESNDLDENNNFENYINKNLINNTNFIFNYFKSIVEIFREKKIFLKVIPNLLNFIIQCNKFIINKQTQFYDNENVSKLINLVKSQPKSNYEQAQEHEGDQEGEYEGHIQQAYPHCLNKFSFDNTNLSIIRKNITEYLNNLNKLIYYFSDVGLGDGKKYFKDELKIVIDREAFLFSSNKELISFLEKIETTRKIICDNFIKQLNYYKEGYFIMEMLNCEEIDRELNHKLVSSK